MFKFTPEQLRKIGGGSDAMLRASLANIVRSEFAYVVNDLPRDLFDEMIEVGIKTARNYGLAKPTDLAGFVMLQFEFGPEFHRHPAVLAILTDPVIDADARLAVVVERTPESVWREIESVLHKQTWFPELRQPEVPEPEAP